MTKHLLIFIHGIGDTESTEQYKTLFDAIGDAYCKIKNISNKDEFYENFKLVGVDWQSHTSESQKTLFELCFPTLEPGNITPWDVFNPVRPLRYFMTYFLGDVVAYVSENDNHIRSTVWSQIEPELKKGIPYTIIAHSLGSIIAFDYLFDLFERNKLFDPINQDEETIKTLQKNFRNFFTLGSPVGLFILRKGELWMENNKFKEIKNPVKDDGRIWLNFYDDQDIIAFPLERLFAQNPVNASRSLKDIPVETGNLVANSHTNYWQNSKVAEEIAKALAEIS